MLVQVSCFFFFFYFLYSKIVEKHVNFNTDGFCLLIFSSNSRIFLRPDSDLRHLNSNMAAVWIKIVSSWLCLAIYAWTLAAPAIFPDRDFS